MKYGAGAIVALALLLGTVAARADVKAGVDAWEQGDYAKAVAEWRPLAQAGDADAQFNLAQAYKLGRGVPMDLTAALDWYHRAALQGHARAEDNYGLLLFQQNRREAAMPFLQHSAERGEPRAQYLVGTALFNGDLLTRDWVRAYALMNRAADAGLPQAGTALAQMDQYIPEGQRKQGIALAADIAAKEQEQKPALGAAPSTRQAAASPPPSAAASIKAAVPSAPGESKGATPAIASGNGWRIQLGAFSSSARAETEWKIISSKVGDLMKYQHYLVAAGAVTRLQAGPFKSRADADRLCALVKAAGADCIIKTL